VRARHMIGIHWGTFDLAEEPIEEPPRRLETEARRLGLGPDRVWLLRHGETRSW
jgi:N-acyl-phosphatidylethanolamine-hydrolysing phospholipase D